MPNTKSKKAAPKKSAPANQKANQQLPAASMQPNSPMAKFFIDALKDIYWAEQHLTKALPKMKKAASSAELQSAIEEHLAQTKEHVNRLEQVFAQLGQQPQAKKCDGMEGLTMEGESIIEETDDGSATRDAGIIVSAQKVEHYEIAAYGSLISMANTMGLEEAAELLNQTLEEEKNSDELLTQIAENSVNWEAEGEEDDDESSEEEK